MRRVAYVIAVTILASQGATLARAADLAVSTPAGAAPSAGVDCDGDEVKAFGSVWLGHFSGGYSHRLAPGLPLVLDWRDEKLCFPSRGSCDRYIRVMRRQFHRPEGDFTCLPLR
jgi:hypothetical protein